MNGRQGKRGVSRSGLLALITAVAVAFGLAVTASSLLAVGGTLMMIVVVLVVSAMVVSPLRGACLLLALCIIFVDGSFRVNIPGQLNIDSQIIAKLSLYSVSFLYAVAVVQRASLALLEMFALLYALALTLTALYAVDPLIALGGASILWSQAILSFAIRTRSATIVALEQVWRAVFYAVLVKIVASWVLLVIDPSAALYNNDPLVQRVNEFAFPRFGGYFGPNGMGFSAALLGVLSLVSWLNAVQRRDRIMATLVGSLASVSLVWSQSRTGMLALLVGVMVVTAVQHRRMFYVSVLVSAILTGYFVLNHRDMLLGFATRGRSTDSLSSLEGRTEIWRALDQKILEEPILGYGYGSARTIVPQLRIGGSYERELYAAHNMFYESMLNGGIAVTIVLVIMIVGAVFLNLRQLRRQLPGSKRHVALLRALATLAILFVNGLAESGIAGIQNLSTLLFFLVVGTISADQRFSDSATDSVGEFQHTAATIAVQ